MLYQALARMLDQDAALVMVITFSLVAT